MKKGLKPSTRSQKALLQMLVFQERMIHSFRFKLWCDTDNRFPNCFLEEIKSHVLYQKLVFGRLLKVYYLKLNDSRALPYGTV